MNKNTTYRIAQFAIYKLDRQSWVLQTTERINIIRDCKIVCVRMNDSLNLFL
jgi:hypothetical protein